MFGIKRGRLSNPFGPFGVYLVVWSVTQGALAGCAAARPWALECNAFGVKIATPFDIELPLIPSVARTRGTRAATLRGRPFFDFQNTF